MSMRELVGPALCISCLCLLIGCDPVRTTRQTFGLRVTDVTTGKPVIGAHVQTKYDFERGEVLLKKWPQLTYEQLAPAREFWQQEPWLSGVTDTRGQARFDVTTTALDRSRGSVPPAGRDLVKGEPYLVKVKVDEFDEEELNLIVNTDENVRGKHYSVTAIEIADPIYFETQSSNGRAKNPR